MKSFFFSILALYFFIDSCTLLSQSLFKEEESLLVKGVGRALAENKGRPLPPPPQKPDSPFLEGGPGSDPEVRVPDAQ